MRRGPTPAPRPVQFQDRTGRLGRRGRARCSVVPDARRRVADRPGRPAVQRSGHHPDGIARRGGRSGRPQARGLRLPAVLGVERQLDPPRLGEALDGRLLRRRRGRQRRPPEDEQRRLDDGRLERLDQLQADERHQRRPRERRPGRPDRPELRLDGGRGGPPEGAAGQLGVPRQSRPPDRRRRARPRRRRRQPRLRADRGDLCRRIHGARPVHPGGTEQGRRRATSSRSTRPAGSATTRSRTRPRRAAPTRS